MLLQWTDKDVSAAPLVYLYSKEAYLPSDIGSQLAHTVPCNGATPLPASQIPHTLTLANLDQLNDSADEGTNVFLKSTVDITTHPSWLRGVLPDKAGRVHGAKTCCVIVADKGNGIVDAFWMFFYAYNYGGVVLEMNLGNAPFPAAEPRAHRCCQTIMLAIGISRASILIAFNSRREHVMVRFRNEVPSVVWYSQHATGQAFKYEVVLKDEAKLRVGRFPRQLETSNVQ